MAVCTSNNCLRLVLWSLYCCKIVTGHGECQHVPRDCFDVKEMGSNTSGVYQVTPVGVSEGFDVYCDMEKDNGGWLVFQRRMDGSVDFYRGWEEYQYGFGNLRGEHWLGNLPLFVITSQGHYELRIDLEDWEGNTRFAKYRIFKVGHPTELYKLALIGYTGNAGDAIGSGQHNGQAFSTRDSDNDLYCGDCANMYMGGWWYNTCYKANLNGLYHQGKYDAPMGKETGVTWVPWKNFDYSLKIVEMKTRRINFK